MATDEKARLKANRRRMATQIVEKGSAYHDPRPETDLGAMRIIAYELLQEHERAGMLPTSIRFLYYELVMRDICSKRRLDQRAPPHLLTDALTDLRQAEAVPWAWIIDETRSLESYIGTDNFRIWLSRRLEYARLDPWDGNPPISAM